jgi:hypothetical protein
MLIISSTMEKVKLPHRTDGLLDCIQEKNMLDSASSIDSASSLVLDSVSSISLFNWNYFSYTRLVFNSRSVKNLQPRNIS